MSSTLNSVEYERIIAAQERARAEIAMQANRQLCAEIQSLRLDLEFARATIARLKASK